MGDPILVRAGRGMAPPTPFALRTAPRMRSFGLGAFVPVLEALRRGIPIGVSCDNEISYGYDDALVTAAESSRERLWGALGTSVADIRTGCGPLGKRANTDDRVSGVVTATR
jgi:hypothetical protein